MMKENINRIVDFIENQYGEQIKKHPTRRNVTPFQVLVWAFLSHRTRDENTARAFNNLFKYVKNPRDIVKMDLKKLQKMIYSVGFYKNKSKRLKELCRVLIEKHEGKIPRTREELMSLPGVGFKTSAIVLSESFNVSIIPIDVHCGRVSKRLGLADLNDDPEEIREKLQKQIPKEKWDIINLGFIKFGREVCKPVNPLCIKNKDACPFSGFCRAYRNKRFRVNPFGKDKNV